MFATVVLVRMELPSLPIQKLLAQDRKSIITAQKLGNLLRLEIMWILIRAEVKLVFLRCANIKGIASLIGKLE